MHPLYKEFTKLLYDEDKEGSVALISRSLEDGSVEIVTLYNLSWVRTTAPSSSGCICAVWNFESFPTIAVIRSLGVSMSLSSFV